MEPRNVFKVVVSCAVGLLAGFSCTFGIDPDSGRFSCTGDADCGAGHECRVQAAGGSLCFPQGQCEDERCDGADNDCNGVVDDTFPERDTACNSGAPGECEPGSYACPAGSLVCVPRVQASDERCDGLDNDCDDAVDETFDLTSDPENCGACQHRCGAGSICRASQCREDDCSDGLDNDGDGLPDCRDADCLGAPCDTLDAGRNCGLVLPDGGVGDGGGAGPVDAGAPDSGPADAGPADAGADDAGPADAGPREGDGGTTDAGTDAGQGLMGACVDRELSCDNSADDDGDGSPDCADGDCDGMSCAVGKVCAMGGCQ